MTSPERRRGLTGGQMIALAAACFLLGIAVLIGWRAGVESRATTQVEQAQQTAESVQSSASAVESQGKAAATQASILQSAGLVAVRDVCPYVTEAQAVRACRAVGYVVAAQSSIISVGGTATPGAVTQVVVQPTIETRTALQLSTVPPPSRAVVTLTPRAATVTIDGQRRTLPAGPPQTTTVTLARGTVTRQVPVTVARSTVAGTQTVRTTLPAETVTVQGETVTIAGPTTTLAVTEQGSTVVVTATDVRTVAATVTDRQTATEVATVTDVREVPVTATQTVTRDVPTIQTVTATQTRDVPGPTVTEPGPTVTHTATVTEPGPTVTTTETRDVPGPTVTETAPTTVTVTVTETAPIFPPPPLSGGP
ncbi:hypothetical protein [Nakamurella aerolata]|uniref:Uncharacterized protein n=1 Tax=Nakamurella aerolata TaxID=1656892 RepID=A0A849ABA8_9ACTN|nr:hypothetical protein [Nakamurella aerolata]NNG36953.1 hypothetical protein [Nakamurella aerolata]